MAKTRRNSNSEQLKRQLRREQSRLERDRTRRPRQERTPAMKKREQMIRLGITASTVVLLAVICCVYLLTKTYHDYKVVRSSEQEDVVSTKYVEMGGKILRYGPDGAVLENSKFQPVWSMTYDMDNPVADVYGNCAVIADIDGTTMEIFNKKGHTGTVTTSYGIVKARVSSDGLVAAILDGGDDTWINYYASDGSLIAENQTKIDDPGYPLDIAVYDNGEIMMVAYQFIEGSDTTSYVAFYNFGTIAQHNDDKIVSGYQYKGTVIPQIEYLSGNKSVAVRDDGFTLYSGGEMPKEVSTVNVEKEIVSTFYDNEMIGLVFKSEDESYSYYMQVYSTNGKEKFKKGFNIPYTNIKVSDGKIIMYNSSQICVLNSNGSERYSGTVDGTIKNIIKVGWNRYLLVLDTGVSIIKFN